MRAVGIDSSLTGTGIFDGKELQTFSSKPLGDTLSDRWRRLALLSDKILTAALVANPNIIVIESPAFSRTTGHHHDRSGLWWLIIHRLLAGYEDIVEVTPTSLKKFATGKGNATKPDMRMALYKRADLDVADDNQVDAWWLHQVGLHLIDAPDRIDLPQPNLEALKKIKGA